MSHNSSQKSSQSQPSSQQTVSSDPSSQQTLSETSSRNSSQSFQPQITFQQRTRGRPITQTYREYPYSLTVDLLPREDVSSQKQPQLDLPLCEKIFSRNSCNSTSPCRNNRNSPPPLRDK